MHGGVGVFGAGQYVLTEDLHLSPALSSYVSVGRYFFSLSFPSNSFLIDCFVTSFLFISLSTGYFLNDINIRFPYHATFRIVGCTG